MAKTIEMEKIEILDLISKKSIEVTFEQLATVAREVLCVPARSTSSERVFSLTGLTLEDRRCSLAPESIDDLLFLHGLRNTNMK